MKLAEYDFTAFSAELIFPISIIFYSLPTAPINIPDWE